MASYNSFKRITSEAIIDGEVRTNNISNDSINSEEIADGAVETLVIENGAVTSGKLNQNFDISTKTVVYRPFIDGDFAGEAISGSQLASGAITANLGYTPVNRAGDTMSGGLIIQNGSVISQSGATTSGIRIAADTLQFRKQGADRLAFNSSGNPVENFKPAWQASGQGGWRYANSYGGPGSWRELDDMAYNFITSGGISVTNNCRVNAPVAGYYYCYLQTYWYNDANDTNGYTHWNIGKNSSPSTMHTGRTPHTMFAYGLRNNHAPGIMCGIVTYMNAGQYVSPQPYFGGNQGRHHGDHLLWCGYLIG